MQISRKSSRRPDAHASRPLRRAGWIVLAVAACALLLATTAPALEPEMPSASSASIEATTAQSSWLLLESMAEGFRAWLPGPMREESSLRDTIAGQVQEKKYFGQEDGRFFSVGLHMLPKLGRWFAPNSLVLSQAKKNVLSTNAGREVSFERRDMGGHPGGVLTYAPVDEDEDFELMEVHLVLVGQRLYVLKASYLHEGDDRTSANRFFDSFEVIN